MNTNLSCSKYMYCQFIARLDTHIYTFTQQVGIKVQIFAKFRPSSHGIHCSVKHCTIKNIAHNLSSYKLTFSFTFKCKLLILTNQTSEISADLRYFVSKLKYKVFSVLGECKLEFFIDGLMYRQSIFATHRGS